MAASGQSRWSRKLLGLSAPPPAPWQLIAAPRRTDSKGQKPSLLSLGDSGKLVGNRRLERGAMILYGSLF